jgi:catechol 2,3-dioxygenase-like lactoylglutathione lyase family enzyme
MMLTDSRAFSGIAVRDLAAARQFYGDVLGLRTSEEHGNLWLLLSGGRDTFVYEQPTASPASYTILNFEVGDVGATVRELSARGVEFQRFHGMPQDEDGVMRGQGPDIAWFSDPSGNVLSVIAAS